MPVTIRPLPVLAAQEAAEFWSLVSIGSEAECWPWEGSGSKEGYGYLFYHSKSYRASRMAYFLATGVDPAPMEVCHTCDNPPCCNPAHLFLGTHLENIADMDAKGRRGIFRPAGEIHGMAVLTPENVQTIKELWWSGTLRQREIAKMFGVTQSHISCIVRNRCWKHLTSAPENQ